MTANRFESFAGPALTLTRNAWRVGSVLGRRFLGTIVARKLVFLVHKTARGVALIARLLRHRNPTAF